MKHFLAPAGCRRPRSPVNWSVSGADLRPSAAPPRRAPPVRPGVACRPRRLVGPTAWNSSSRPPRSPPCSDAALSSRGSSISRGAFASMASSRARSRATTRSSSATAPRSTPRLSVATVIVRGGIVHGNIRAKTRHRDPRPGQDRRQPALAFPLHRSRRRVPGELPHGRRSMRRRRQPRPPPRRLRARLVREAVAFLLLACACGAATWSGRSSDARRRPTARRRRPQVQEAT